MVADDAFCVESIVCKVLKVAGGDGMVAFGGEVALRTFEEEATLGAGDEMIGLVTD